MRFSSARPIYFGTETGEMKSCMERLLFQYLTYTSHQDHCLTGNPDCVYLHDERFGRDDEEHQYPCILV